MTDIKAPVEKSPTHLLYAFYGVVVYKGSVPSNYLVKSDDFVVFDSCKVKAISNPDINVYSQVTGEIHKECISSVVLMKDGRWKQGEARCIERYASFAVLPIGKLFTAYMTVSYEAFLTPAPFKGITTTYCRNAARLKLSTGIPVLGDNIASYTKNLLDMSQDIILAVNKAKSWPINEINIAIKYATVTVPIL
jgi:hypothetical protein